MAEATKKAEAFMKQRQADNRSQQSKRGGGSGSNPPVISETPLIKNNLYKLDAWLQPFADVKVLH